MNRGSISDWQDYGRRNSYSMAQFRGGPVEFMTSDGIECKRGDGYFLSYPKIAAVVVVFVIGVLAAGFLGWYINSLPKKKLHDPFSLINDEIEEDELITSSFSPYIHPLKYRLELTPLIDVNGTSTLKGRAAIEFRVNDTASLSKLSLSAKNITVTSYKLSLLDLSENKTQFRRSARDETNNGIYGAGATLVTNAGSSLTESRTILYEEAMDYSIKDATSDVELYETSTIAHGTSSSRQKREVEEEHLPVSEQPATAFSGISSSSAMEIEITKYKVDEDKGTHVIYFGSHIDQGTYLLDIDYETLIDDDAFYVGNFDDSDEETWLIGTKLKPFSIRRLLPVFDDVELKSVFSVSVARPRETRVLSNMPLRTSRDTGGNDSMIIDTFDDTPLLSAHNLALTMGHIESVASTFVGDSTVTFWGDSKRRSQGIYLVDKLDPAVINLIDMFSMPYPLPKLDLVGLPQGIDENMGKPGLISMKQSLFYTNTESPLVTKYEALTTLVNLLGQQWLGGLVNVNWTDAWVLKGCLLYLQHEIVQKIDSSLDSSDSFIVDVQANAMQIDGYGMSRPLRTNVNHVHSDDDRYAKGACLIRMLHGAITDTAFREGYKKFIARWKYGITNVAEFLNIMAEETNEIPPDVSLEKLMDSWISERGYPLVTVTRNYEEGSVNIRQEQFTYDRTLGEPDKLWHIPLSYIYEDGNWSSPAMLWLEPETHMTLHDVGQNGSWILFNINKTGYYRVQYDEENWALLKTAFEENHELFPAETRSSLIDDIFSLAAVGLMKYKTVFDFIKYMQMKERHYAPWGVLMRHVFKLNSLLYETLPFTDFQEFMLNFTLPLYTGVGPKIKEGSRLTFITMQMACVFEHVECLEWARNTFDNAKTDAEIREIIPSYLRETFYCTIARYGTRREWNYFIEHATSIADREERKRLLSSFACFQAPWILQNILNEVLHGDMFREDEISMILRTFPENRAAAQTASRFVRANWHDVVQRFSGSHSVLRSFVLSMVNGLTTEQDLEDLQTFRENNYESMKGVMHASAVVEANANFVTSWLKNSLPEIESFLKPAGNVSISVQ